MNKFFLTMGNYRLFKHGDHIIGAKDKEQAFLWMKKRNSEVKIEDFELVYRNAEFCVGETDCYSNIISFQSAIEKLIDSPTIFNDLIGK